MSSPLLKSVKAWAGWLLLGLLLVTVALSIVHSEAIQSVTIQLIDAESEVRDPSIPGMAKANALPDYRVEVVRTSGSRINLGTILNTSASEPLHWEIQDPIPLAKAASLRLVEDDKLANDVLEEVQIEGTSFASASYRYEIEIGRTPAAAVEYFFGTPLGIAILVAIGAALFLTIFS